MYAPTIKRSLSHDRRQAGLDPAQDLVTEEPGDGRSFPAIFRPSIGGVELIAWAAAHRGYLLDRLLTKGALLFRGFDLPGLEPFQAFARAVCGELMDYTYRSTPRTHVAGGIYTSTEYPAQYSIPLHNEMAYTPSWPLKIAFYSAVCAASGGETPIADSRRVYQRIDPGVRARFAAKRVMYVRNYGDGLDLRWQEVFQTSDRREVEAYCRQTSIELEWKPDNRLRTRQVCQAIATHPRTGDVVWFNQAHLFHVSSLPDAMRATLLRGVAADELPRNAYYGDGSEIEAEALDHVREAYARETVAFAWEQADVLLLDNMLTAHGRLPFTGPRQVLVAMAEPHGGSAEVLS